MAEERGLSEVFSRVRPAERPHAPQYGESRYDRYLPERQYTAQEQAEAVYFFELEHKRVNGGLSVREMSVLSHEEQKRRGLWISRAERHLSEPQYEGLQRWLAPEERRDQRVGQIRAAGTMGSVTVKEYLADWRLPEAPLRPAVDLDASVSVPRRIQRLYDHGRFYPHAQLPEIITHDADGPHPYLIEQDVFGCSYAEKWGRNATVADRKTARPEIKGRGSFGWSWRQKRSFIRNLALIRIMFLYIRSGAIRGGGDDRPFVTAPHMAYMHEAYVTADDETLNLGPWLSVEDMLRAVVARNRRYWTGMDEYVLEKQEEGIGNRPRLPLAATQLAQARAAGKRECPKAPQLDAIRAKDRELFVGGKPFGLHLWADIRSSLMMNDTRIIGLDNFQKSIYAPYSVAISDVTNQYNPNARSVYYDSGDWEGVEPPFKIPRRYLHEKKTGKVPRGSQHSSPRAFPPELPFDLQLPILGEMCGEITLEDLEYGDRYDDLENEYDIPPVIMSEDPGEGDENHWEYENYRTEAEDWFVIPVLGLVNRFVETYLSDDPTVKWLEPEVAEHLLYAMTFPEFDENTQGQQLKLPGYG